MDSQMEKRNLSYSIVHQVKVYCFNGLNRFDTLRLFSFKPRSVKYVMALAKSSGMPS